jgi:Xaa-Pro aminopeptidase
MAHDQFSADFFSGNRARLRTLFTGTAPVVLTAAGLLQRGGDSSFPFHQDSSFWYLTGINEPDVILVMDKDKDYLIVPGRDVGRAAFDGTIDDRLLRRVSGIDTILNEKDGWKAIGNRLKKVKHVATLAAAPAYIEQYGLYTNPARGRLMQRLKDCNESIEFLDLREHLARMRMIKQPAELKALQAAIDLTIDSLKTVTKPANLAKYAYEYELEADLTRLFRRGGASGHAFAPIVAGGLQACVLHNVANEAPLSSDELVVLDIGAEVNHYAADITRTVSLNTQSGMTRRQQAIHQAVADTQSYALGQLKPGVLLKEYEQHIEQFIGEKMRELGLIKMVEHDEVRRFYPHSASHFLGLDVHDIGDYQLPLEPGMVLTCEPGIYVPEEAIGVRIEDDVLITETGVEVLSKRLPTTL